MGCIKEADSSDYRATQQSNPSVAQANQDATGDPVNVVTGAFTLTETDVKFPSQRLILDLTRHYDNQHHDCDDSAPVGPFGRGWTHSLNLALELESAGTQVTYVDDKGAKIEFACGPDGTFSSPPGSLGLELVGTENGGYRLRQIDGLLAEFDGTGKINALVRPGPESDSNLQFTYDDQGRLTRATGVAGRGIWLRYGRDARLIEEVVDHTQRTWRYRYNQRQELVSVTDPLGRVREYEYGEWNGQVSEVDENIVGTSAKGAVATGKGKTASRRIRALSKVFRYRWANSTDPRVVEVENQYTSDRRVFRQMDALRNETRFDYNRFTRTTFVTDPAGWTTVYCYDADGNTTKVRRPGGGTIEYVYDNHRNLLAEIDPLGYRTEYVTFLDSQRLSREEAYGRRAIANRSDYLRVTTEEILVGYDPRGNRPLVRDAIGRITTFDDYNQFGAPTQTTLPNGLLITTEADYRSGLPLNQTSKSLDGQSTKSNWNQKWGYDSWGNVIRQEEWTDDERLEAIPKRVIDIEFDPSGMHPVQRRSWIESEEMGESLASEEQFDWDDLGRLTQRTVLYRVSTDATPMRRTERFAYDSLDRPIWNIDPIGTATCWQYDLDGRIVESFIVLKVKPDEDPSLAPIQNRLRCHKWSFDAVGQCVLYVDPRGAETRRSWNDCGWCTEETDPVGLRTQYEYDRDGNLILETAPSGLRVRRRYDLAGRMVSEATSLGFSRDYVYDPAGRLTELAEVSANGPSETKYGYGHENLPNVVTLPDGTVELTRRNQFGQMVGRERGRQGHMPTLQQSYVYDGLGRLTEIQIGDSTSSITQFQLVYDDAAQAVEVYDALGNVSRSEFDSEGNLVSRCDAEGRTVRFLFDAKQRLVKRTADDNSVHSEYTYDAFDQLVQAIEGGVRYCWDFDESGNVIQHDQQVDDQKWGIAYEFDLAGRLMRKSMDHDWWMEFAYSAESPFATTIRFPQTEIRLEVNEDGRVLAEHWPDGGWARYGYDVGGNLTHLESVDGQHHPVFTQMFERDNRGRPVRETRTVRDQTTLYDYSYDELDRLMSVTSCNVANASKEQFRRYVYDVRGNRIKEYRKERLHTQHTYNSANQLVETRDADGSVLEREYDRCGNLVRQEGLQLDYDALHRIRSARSSKSGESIADFRYAATDQRVVIGHPGRQEVVVYDGFHEALSVAATKANRAFWGFGTDALVAEREGGNATRRTFTDASGSVTSQPDHSELVTYDPFGVPISSNGPYRFGFLGKRFDLALGLYDGRARLYDPDSGRYVQPDPAGWLDDSNIYQYARLNPMVRIDPTGLASVKSSQGKISESSKQVGSITYRPLDSLGRPTGTVAVVTKGMINTGTKATVTPPGYQSELGATHHKGHLIAKELGGSGADSRNVATMQSHVNNAGSRNSLINGGTLGMRSFERQVRHMVESGEIVALEVTPSYKGTNLVARGFTIGVQSSSGTNFSVSLLNR